jgi:hypothetical protein
MKTITYVGVGAVFALSALVGTAVSQAEGDHAPVIIHRVITPREGFAPTAGSTGAQSPPISYHRGPVMASPNVYLIWYGNWNQANNSDTPGGQTIVTDFLSGLTGSSYFAINKTYSTPTGTFTVAASTADSYSQGSNLTDAGVQAVVSNAIANRSLPLDANGIYFVLTSTDVAESSGFCTKYCGWHTYGTITGANIKYAFVGNSNRCLGGCAAQTTSPNGNPGVDGMISVIAHELAEATTDPDLNAWYDPKGAENADKCAWTFGQNQTLLNGAWYNVTLPAPGGPRNYLIQRNLQANNSKCYVALNGQQ